MIEIGPREQREIYLAVRDAMKEHLDANPVECATLAEIRAILAEPVRDVVEDPFSTPWHFQDLRLHYKQWKRLHELLGGDHG